jgi:hypothetical protein
MSNLETSFKHCPVVFRFRFFDEDYDILEHGVAEGGRSIDKLQDVVRDRPV